VSKRELSESEIPESKLSRVEEGEAIDSSWLERRNGKKCVLFLPCGFLWSTNARGPQEGNSLSWQFFGWENRMEKIL